MRLVIALALASASMGYGYAEEARSALFLQQPGRYQIVFGQHARADTFLLDTGTGKVWQLTRFSTLKDEPLAWQFMQRIDDDTALFAFISEHGFKPKEKAATPAPPAAGPPIQLR